MTQSNIADLLAEEAEQAEEHREDELTPGYRRARPAREPAQVYSMRIPVERLEQLRSLAAERHMTPSGLMRAWVLDRLDVEAADSAASSGVSHLGTESEMLPLLRLVLREELERAVTYAVSEGEESERRHARQRSRRQRSAEIRAWAKRHGYDITERGRIPASVVQDYEKAQ